MTIFISTEEGGGVKGNEVRGEAALARAGPGALESLALYDAKAAAAATEAKIAKSQSSQLVESSSSARGHETAVTERMRPDGMDEHGMFEVDLGLQSHPLYEAIGNNRWDEVLTILDIEEETTSDDVTWTVVSRIQTIIRICLIGPSSPSWRRWRD